MGANKRLHIDILDGDGCVIATSYAFTSGSNDAFLELAKVINECTKDVINCEYFNTDDIEAYENGDF